MDYQVQKAGGIWLLACSNELNKIESRDYWKNERDRDREIKGTRKRYQRRQQEAEFTGGAPATIGGMEKRTKQPGEYETEEWSGLAVCTKKS